MATSRIGLGVLLMFLVACGGAANEAKSAASAPPGSGAHAAEAGYPAGEAADAPVSESAAPRATSAAGVPGAAPAVAPAAEPPGLATGASADVPRDRAPSGEAPIARRPAPPPPPRPQAGQLTAGVWDDNRNFDFFKPYAAAFRERNGTDFAMFAEQEMTTARDLAAQGGAPHAELDVQLVLDTTGSMGDELSYLQSEFDAIATKVRVKFPNVTPRWSLVVYRDRGDEYVTRQFEFTSDTARFRKSLQTQRAGGGGDTPEAVVDGLQAGLRQGWRSAPTVAKVMFWVADAPAHPGEGQGLANVLRDAQRRGVHIYPVASSDTDPAAEYQMRSAAQLTGGRYVFLTNDSGIGNDHAEPHIPCYSVTRLDGAIVRMIQVEMTGRHVEAEANDVIRSVGRPDKEGKCTLSSGALVASF